MAANDTVALRSTQNAALGTPIFKDASGNGNDGVPVNVPSFTTNPAGKADSAMTFNGSTDSIDMGDVLNIGTGDYSVSLWFKTTSSGSKRALISKYHPGYFLSIGTANKFQIVVYNLVTKVDQQSDNTVNDGVWHNAIVTFDRSGYCKTFIDSVEQAAKTDISSFSGEDWTAPGGDAKDLLIGRGHSGWSAADGDLCNFRIYNRVLAPIEIGTIYNYDLSGTGSIPQSGLVGEWNLSQGNYHDTQEVLVDVPTGTYTVDAALHAFEDAINDDANMVGTYTVTMVSSVVNIAINSGRVSYNDDNTDDGTVWGFDKDIDGAINISAQNSPTLD